MLAIFSRRAESCAAHKSYIAPGRAGLVGFLPTSPPSGASFSRAADWVKHGCFGLSMRRIWQNTSVSHFPRIRLDEKSSFLAIRAADCAKSRVFMLSAPQIRRKVEFSCNLRVRLDEKSSFLVFRAVDWAKSPVFPQSARQIRQKVEFSRFLRGKLDGKSSFPAIRARRDSYFFFPRECGILYAQEVLNG